MGPTEELNLRVSVAALARVLLDHPETGQTLLVLERAATLEERQGGPEVVVRAKPYGGGVRLRDPGALRAAIGEFQFDSPRSREEADFRILIREEDWQSVRAFCLSHFQKDDGALEANPERELTEELQDALKTSLEEEHPWTLRPLGLIIEAAPTPTASPRAPGLPTVRIYNIYQARLDSPALIAAVLANNAAFSDEHLRQLAWEDRRRGGGGRANAVLVVPLDRLVDAYRAGPIEERGNPLRFSGHLMDGNVPAILPEIETRKYQWRHADRCT